MTDFGFAPHVTVLYRKNKLGVGTWRIHQDGSKIVIAHATTIGGSEVVHEEHVPAGLAGRSLEEQVKSRINSRVNKQRDKGYVDTFEEARDQPRTNMLGLPHPMLAKKLKDLRTWPGKGIGQPKYDGFRFMVTASEEGEVIMYTRGGKIIDAPSHIGDRLKGHLYPGLVLDGELYCHGIPLQTIASWAKAKQKDTERLIYRVYDSMSDDPFLVRYNEAAEVVAKANSEKIVMVPNHHVSSEEDMWAIFEKYRGDGYEGAMYRRLDLPYEGGSRSNGLIKFKKREDAEFKVVEIVEDANGNALLTCQISNGRVFDTSAPGNFDQKKFVLAHKDQYIGRSVTVEFANYTKDGIPFHAVATRWLEVL